MQKLQPLQERGLPDPEHFVQQLQQLFLELCLPCLFVNDAELLMSVSMSMSMPISKSMSISTSKDKFSLQSLCLTFSRIPLKSARL